MAGSEIDGGFPPLNPTRIQSNWRDDPNIVFRRQEVWASIARYLARNHGWIPEEKRLMAATKCEYRLLVEANSKEEYMNHHKSNSRLKRLIRYKLLRKKCLPANQGSDRSTAACNPLTTDNQQYRLAESSLNPMAGAQMSSNWPGIGVSLMEMRQRHIDMITPHISSAQDSASGIQNVGSELTYSGRYGGYLTNNAWPVHPGSDCFTAVCNPVTTNTEQHCLTESSLNPIAGAQMGPYRTGVDVSPMGIRRRCINKLSPQISSAGGSIENVDSGPTYSGRYGGYLSNNASPANLGSDRFSAVSNPVTADNQRYHLAESSFNCMAGPQMNPYSPGIRVSPMGTSLRHIDMISSHISSARDSASDIQNVDGGPTYSGRYGGYLTNNASSVDPGSDCLTAACNLVTTDNQQYRLAESFLNPMAGSQMNPRTPGVGVSLMERKQSLDMILPHNEQCESHMFSARESFSEPMDSGQTFSGSILTDESEPSSRGPVGLQHLAEGLKHQRSVLHSDSGVQLPVPSKFRKLNPSDDGLAPVMGFLPNTEEYPILQQSSPSLEFVSSEAAEVNPEMITILKSNSSISGEYKNDTEDAPQNTNFEALPAVPEEAFVDCKSEEMQRATDLRLPDKAIRKSCTPSECCPILTTEQLSEQNNTTVVRKKCDGVVPYVAGESLCATSLGTGKKPEKEKQKNVGVSLTEFFTAKEVKDHVCSLRKFCDQDLPGNMLMSSSHPTSGNTCYLCGLDRLAFPPMPIYCSACCVRIKDYATYYFKLDEDGDPFSFCSTCYNKSRGKNIIFRQLSVPKCKLEMKKNDVVTEESWVQCDRCEGWQHQICALFIDKRDTGRKSEYICPKCYLDDLETGERMPLSRASGFGVSNLQRTKLSDHIEERLFKHLKQEREERAMVTGKNVEEVPEATDLAVRVVSSVDKLLKVKQLFLDILPDKSYPAELPYRSKVILLFQKIEGVDVCLFGMYVQEYGSECSRPNQRCVYVSYLDSVKYFQPEIRAVTGEALRTFIYHEILIAYLEYCKKRGFATCYIWACPAVKGEDYILYRHPETQKTPKPQKLRQWYQDMLRKASKEKIVVNYTNLYEQFFLPHEDCNRKVTAAQLPYFDGDYWHGVAEHLIKKIEQESDGNRLKKLQKFTQKTLRAMGHINPSGDDAKDILLMNELGQDICSAKEDFLVVHLQPVCVHCHKVILSGKKWFCNQCSNYQLCERCHYPKSGSTHITSSGQEHALSEKVVSDIPVITEDNDAMMDNRFLESRSAFLSFCQGNHYQFDTLRRAKYSSTMILYHLHKPNVVTGGTMCSLCQIDTMVDPHWKCEKYTGFSVCGACYQRNGAACHNHQLTRYPPAADCSPRLNKADMLRSILLHASKCCASTTPCSYPKCDAIRRLFSHAHSCKTRVSGGCVPCMKTWKLLKLHSQKCKDPNCGVPRCSDLKRHSQRLVQLSNALHRDTVPEVGVQLAAKS